MARLMDGCQSASVLADGKLQGYSLGKKNNHGEGYTPLIKLVIC